MADTEVKQEYVHWTPEEDSVLLTAYKEHVSQTLEARKTHSLGPKRFIEGIVSGVLSHRTHQAIKSRLKHLRHRGLLPIQRPKREYKLLDLSPADCGWLAGILDGEGSVKKPAYGRRWGTDYGVKNIQITLCYNTDPAIVSKVLRLVPHGRPFWSTPEQQNRYANVRKSKRSICCITLSGFNPILDYIEHVLPYVAGDKHAKLVYMRDFIRERMVWHGR